MPQWLIFFFLWLLTKEEVDWKFVQPNDPRYDDDGEWIIEDEY